MAESRKESALERHIGFFSKNGQVSYESMLERLSELGDPDAKFKANAVSIMAGIKVKGCPYSMFQPSEGVGILNHPRDTGIYKTDGSINEERWEKLMTWSEIDNETAIITEKNFRSFLAWARENDDRWDIGGLGKQFSNGEWNDFFTFCTDYWKKTDAGMERSVTISTLRKFFDNTPEILTRTIRGELPVIESKVLS